MERPKEEEEGKAPQRKAKERVKEERESVVQAVQAESVESLCRGSNPTARSWSHLVDEGTAIANGGIRGISRG